jgi:GNAT superfamily N-acetyltransferase
MTSDSKPAGYGVHMIRPDLGGIPQAPFPDGFSIRPLQTDEGSLWTDIVLEAEEWLDLSRDLFDREFGHDLAAVPQRCFLIVDAEDHAVGTVSAWYRRDYRGLDYGLIHWVAIRPAWQGQGLGKAGLAFALHRLAQWHERALLGTQTRRLPAIALYLNWGFRPDLHSPEARYSWRQLREEMPHPALEDLDL